jgi:N-acetylglutamate synthase-like GNAT family acetyltransferase
MEAFRKAVPEDMDGIYLLGRDVWGKEHDIDAYLAECRGSLKYKTGEWFLAEGEGARLLGALIVYRFSAESAGIGSIATAPAERRKGYASRLIEAVLQRLDEEGVRHVFLFSDIAPRFYERFGFKPLPDERQTRAGTVCMVRTRTLHELLAELDFQPPAYF